MFKLKFMLKWMLSLEVNNLRFVRIIEDNFFDLDIDDKERACTMEDIQEMTYFELVIKVSLI